MSKIILNLTFALITFLGFAQSTLIVAGGQPDNDIVTILKANNIQHHYYQNISKAIKKAKRGQGLFLISNDGELQKQIDLKIFKKAKSKNLHIYIEGGLGLPGLSSAGELNILKERGVVLTNTIPGLSSMDILGINNKEIVLYEDDIKLFKSPLVVLGKVAGSERAEYGIEDIETYPLLFHMEKNFLVSATRLSNVIKGRFGPTENWKHLFGYIISWLRSSPTILDSWPTSVHPNHNANSQIDKDAITKSVTKGSEWFFNTKLLVHPNWESEYYQKTDKNGKNVVHPAVAKHKPIGNGLNGILEGHASRINPDGSQPYRWWIRADCQAETAFALSSSALLKDNEKYTATAKNLLTYLFKNSNLRQGERNDPDSPSFGLIGWSTTDPDAYYGDDNARALLAVIGASTNLNISDWNEQLVEGILANFRTAGTNGFRGPWFRDAGMQKTTWQKLGQRNIVNIHPHYESWLWALYLWLYDKTEYAPLLEKSKAAIAITMEAFPDWKWTNGIQQEYTRMILPLAWLVRVDDTPKHREWLNMVIQKLTKDLDPSGAIPERFGKSGFGRYEKIQSNAEYGTKEAPLISSTEDKVSDMLYTMNFALFSLNEAYQATGNNHYEALTKSIADFLVKIQIASTDQPDLDGAWFRAFDYGKWEYWASNADSDWGPWGTLTGWTQSWIINGLIHHHTNTNLWDSSKKHYQNSEFKNITSSKINTMLTQ
ncbi:hypothetical protein [Gelidibacter maritimus]|uniref:Alpha-L-rhamnosidase six-hairpin glycosidase domain-containing protein n=1 Tax=Gelidibacter maritimus TaxID=2761487 RepID=A0A7W2M5L2_9FLAO|nr:hypothetical protein [Gelidibacter maritimus]MBA6153114.1 hypothetical protein [Gelidibacter maritimus]